MKVWNWTWHEIKLQWMNGLYIIYLLVNLIYIFALGYVPQEYKALVTTLLILSDPTFLGMIFVGGILLLEKNQGIPKGIGISPLGSYGYVISKVISLLVIALVTSISLMVTGGIEITVTKVIGILLGSSIFTMMGIIVGSYAEGTNHFIVLIVGVSSLLALPIFTFYLWRSFTVFNFMPIYAMIRLLEGEEALQTVILSGLYLCIWLIGIGMITSKVVENKIFVR